MMMPVPSALVVLLAVGARAGSPLTLSNSVVRASIDGGGGECTHCSQHDISSLGQRWLYSVTPEVRLT